MALFALIINFPYYTAICGSYLTQLPFFDRIPVHKAKEFRKADHNLNKMLDESLERKKNSQKLRVQAGIYRMIASIKLTFSFKVRL